MVLQRPYDHRQFGWVVFSALLLPLAALLPIGALPGTKSVILTVIALVTLSVLLFGTMRVRVDDSAISLRFGIGLIHRRIDLAEIHGFAKVQNPWYWRRTYSLVLGLRRAPSTAAAANPIHAHQENGECADGRKTVHPLPLALPPPVGLVLPVGGGV
jgi:hypothetical protein